MQSVNQVIAGGEFGLGVRVVQGHISLRWEIDIRVNAVAPGTIATSFHDRFNTPENRERMKGIYPLRREGDAGGVADLVLFLACDDSDYITGTNIDINGGIFFS